MSMELCIFVTHSFLSLIHIFFPFSESFRNLRQLFQQLLCPYSRRPETQSAVQVRDTESLAVAWREKGCDGNRAYYPEPFSIWPNDGHTYGHELRQCQWGTPSKEKGCDYCEGVYILLMSHLCSGIKATIMIKSGPLFFFPANNIISTSLKQSASLVHLALFLAN